MFYLLEFNGTNNWIEFVGTKSRFYCRLSDWSFVHRCLRDGWEREKGVWIVLLSSNKDSFCAVCVGSTKRQTESPIQSDWTQFVQTWQLVIRFQTGNSLEREKKSVSIATHIRRYLGWVSWTGGVALLSGPIHWIHVLGSVSDKILFKDNLKVFYLAYENPKWSLDSVLLCWLLQSQREFVVGVLSKREELCVFTKRFQVLPLFRR